MLARVKGCEGERSWGCSLGYLYLLRKSDMYKVPAIVVNRSADKNKVADTDVAQNTGDVDSC